MKRIALLFSIIILASGFCLAQTSGFTYQGRLADAGSPATGLYDLTFRLFPIVSGGAQIGADVVRDDVQVTNGVFTVSLDFGTSPFTSDTARYLEIGVRPGVSTGAYTTLAPRQPITSSPYSVASLNAANATNATNATQLGGVAASQFVQTADTRLSDARTPTAGSANYIQNQNAVFQPGNFTIDGTGTAIVLRAENQFNIGADRVLSTGAGITVNAIWNLFAGVGAGQNDTGVGSGTANSFFGFNSGFSNTSGGGNAFVGFLAGSNNTTGINNTFVGETNGLSNTVENANTFIGGQVNGVAGITNATAIGFKASVTQSNSLVLGSINGVNSATADTKVGIGTTAPLFKFHVKTGTDQNLVVRPGNDFSPSLTGIGLQSVNDANSLYQPLDLEGSQITLNAGSGANVGIGTITPAFKLEIVDSANTGLRVQTNALGGTVASFGGRGAFHIDAAGIAGGRLKITESGQVSIPLPSSLILRSPDNACWAINVSNAGVLSTTSVACP